MATYFIKAKELDEGEAPIGDYKTDAAAMKQAEVVLQESLELGIEKETQCTFQLWINESHGANFVEEKTISIKPY